MAASGWSEKVADELSAAFKGFDAAEFRRLSDSLWSAVAETERALTQLASIIETTRKADAESRADLAKRIANLDARLTVDGTELDPSRRPPP